MEEEKRETKRQAADGRNGGKPRAEQNVREHRPGHSDSALRKWKDDGEKRRKESRRGGQEENRGRRGRHRGGEELASRGWLPRDA